MWDILIVLMWDILQMWMVSGSIQMWNIPREEYKCGILFGKYANMGYSSGSVQLWVIFGDVGYSYYANVGYSENVNGIRKYTNEGYSSGSIEMWDIPREVHKWGIFLGKNQMWDCPREEPIVGYFSGSMQMWMVISIIMKCHPFFCVIICFFLWLSTDILLSFTFKTLNIHRKRTN